jgi:hypothetical protein
MANGRHAGLSSYWSAFGAPHAILSRLRTPLSECSDPSACRPTTRPSEHDCRCPYYVNVLTQARAGQRLTPQNTIVVVHVPGSELKTALEHGVGSIEEGEGRFPQISGVSCGHTRSRLFIATPRFRYNLWAVKSAVSRINLSIPTLRFRYKFAVSRSRLLPGTA